MLQGEKEMICKICGGLTRNRAFCTKACRDIFHHKDKETL